VQTAFAAIFVFLLVILLHELGHFTVAKLVGIRVNEFSIGMGPKIIQKEKGETRYSLRLLPIGGYVKMEGEDEDSDDPRGFGKASPQARIAVVIAGAFMNFVLAIIVLSIVSFNIGRPTTTIQSISPNSPAQDAGFLSGDKVIAINDISIKNWEGLTEVIGSAGVNEPLMIEISREGLSKTIPVTPVTEDNRSIIGIIPRYERSLGQSIKGGLENTGYFIKLMFDFIKMVFRGQVTTNDLSGPIGVINEVGQAAKMGINNLLLILGFISVNLGFFNLLPIPALDGSRIIFLLVELVRGKPIDPEKENIIHLIGFALLISLMLFITYKDILEIIKG